ncbi:MAG: glycosyltransferase family 2 protein [Alphaproteobacteria bacterium]|nr:glycosyltransferase family 2 protein [Alphaproteobacteria bacterium]
MPEISIIVPNFNTEKYIARCVDSLIHQTFQDIEIIVIDDGSTDNSINILKGYQDNRLHILFHKGDGFGPGGARNLGLEKATGKYVMFCDSDDWYEPNMCQKMYDTIEKYQVDVVCCQNFYDIEDGLSKAERNKRSKNQSFPLNLNIYPAKNHILKANVVLWNKIWRRSLIERYNIRFILQNEHDDDAFWYMYASIGSTIYYLKEKLYHYFLRKNSIMSLAFHKKPKNPSDRFQICMAIFNFLSIHNILNKHKNLILKVFKNEMCESVEVVPMEKLKEYCEILNNLIKNNLKSNAYLVVGDRSVFLIKRYSKIKLWALFFLFHFKKRIYWFVKEEKYKKYIKKINQVQSVLKII